MAKQSRKAIPKAKENPKRGIAKAKRDKGQLAMKAKKMDEIQWGQKHDPLFRIKGKERHRRIKEIR